MPDNPEVQAVILAGGKGTRLRPVTAELPKPLVPIANRPLMEHQLRHLAAAGVRDVTLALGYNAAAFAGVEREADELGLRLRILTEPAPLGTGGALRWCLDGGAFDERPLLWLNGDVVASPDVASLLEFHTSRAASLTFWLTSVRDVTDFGVLELDPEGRVQRFLEKPAPEESPSNLVNAGILMLDPQMLSRVPPDTFFSFEKSLLPGLVREREPIYGLFDGGYWMDTGRPRTYLAANRHVLENRVDWEPAGELREGVWEGPGVKRDGAIIIHPTVLGEGAVIEDGANIFGRVVVGRGTVVHEGAQLDSSVLHDDVEIGRDCEIVNSIVCKGARIGDGVVLEHAIVGARAVVGERNVLRGARLWNDIELPRRSLVIDQL
ncbi:MAG TPA: NDP-sugar synthase [Egibacteraceae bacterium]|nr:NDP-sugar synthase [Egibacteraceae bacterium]